MLLILCLPANKAKRNEEENDGFCFICPCSTVDSFVMSFTPGASILLSYEMYLRKSGQSRFHILPPVHIKVGVL